MFEPVEVGVLQEKPSRSTDCESDDGHGAIAKSTCLTIDRADPSLTIPWLKLAAILLAGYVLMMFILTPNNSVIGFPIHHDDYDNLSRTNRPRLTGPRPVSYFAYYLVNHFGRSATYLCLHLFTMLYPFLVLVFLTIFCRLDVSFFRTAAFALLCFSSSSVVESGKYTGMMTSQVSMLFGVGALIAFHLSHTRKEWVWLFVGATSFALSVFAKEDFILPVLCIAVYHLASPRISKGRALVEIASVIGVCALLYIHTSLFKDNVYVKGDSDPSAPYFVNLEFWSVARVFRHYVGVTLPNWPVRIAFLIAGMAWLLKGWWREYLALAAVAVGLIAPYTVLPNHIFNFYSTNWVCWWVGLIAFTPIPFRLPRLQRATYRILAGAMALVVFSVTWDTQTTRVSVSQWYETMIRKNQRMVKSLLRHQRELGTVPSVGIVGVTDLSPWLKHQGEFLCQLGLTNQWIVFVPPDLPWYKMLLEPGDQVVPGKRTCILSSAAIGKYPDLLYIRFDADGNLTALGRPPK